MTLRHYPHPLAEVTAIGYLNPVVVMVGAALLMGERLSRARVLAIVVALLHDARLAAAPMAVTQPVTFLQLVWATVLGVLAFGDPLDPWVLLGGAVMIAAISAVTWAEGRAR